MRRSIPPFGSYPKSLRIIASSWPTTRDSFRGSLPNASIFSFRGIRMGGRWAPICSDCLGVFYGLWVCTIRACSIAKVRNYTFTEAVGTRVCLRGWALPARSYCWRFEFRSTRRFGRCRTGRRSDFRDDASSRPPGLSLPRRRRKTRVDEISDVLVVFVGERLACVHGRNRVEIVDLQTFI